MAQGTVAGVLMDVTMTTKDPLGEGRSKRSSLELWKTVIKWKLYLKYSWLEAV